MAKKSKNTKSTGNTSETASTKAAPSKDSKKEPTKADKGPTSPVDTNKTSKWVPNSLHFGARNCVVVKIPDAKKIFFKCACFLEDAQMSVGMIITTFEMHFAFMGELNSDTFLEKVIFGNIMGKVLASLKPKTGMCGQDSSIYLMKLDEAKKQFEGIRATFLSESQAGCTPEEIKVPSYLLSRLTTELNKSLVIEHQKTEIDFKSVELVKRGIIGKSIPISTGVSAAKLNYAVKDSHATMAIDVSMNTIALENGPTIMSIKDTKDFKINNKLS